MFTPKPSRPAFSSELQIFKGVPHVWHLMTPFVPEARAHCGRSRNLLTGIERHPAGARAAETLSRRDDSSRRALAYSFTRSGLGADGGYGARWVRIETKPVPVYFPNTACRVEAAKLHDLHHIAMEYETDWPGEAWSIPKHGDIAPWLQRSSGCCLDYFGGASGAAASPGAVLVNPRRFRSGATSGAAPVKSRNSLSASLLPPRESSVLRK